MNRNRPGRIAQLVLMLLAAMTQDSFALEKPIDGTYFQDERMLIRLLPRTPTQMAAFYEARGFPAAALQRIRDTCFITLSIRNNSAEVLMVDLARWHFTHNGKPVNRLDQPYWKQQWNEIGLRQASRSTFGWTQFPDMRDLQPDEGVGGNLVFPGSLQDVSIEAVLHTGVTPDGPEIRIGFGNVSCRKDKPDQ